MIPKATTPDDVRKTTVTIPLPVLSGLQLYIAKTPGLGFHDQSNVVVTAIIEFLQKNGVEIDTTDKRVKKFLVIDLH